MFRRRRRDEEPEKNLEPTDEETVAAEESEAEEAGSEGEQERAAVSHGGPWDAAADSIPEIERVDFGAIRVPIAEGIEHQLNIEDAEQDAQGNLVGGNFVAVTVVTGESGLQLQAFAAPKKSGLWDELREEIAEEIKQAQGETQEAEGPFGTELHAMVPVAIPEELKDQVPPEVAEQGYGWQPVRFLGVDGPRWFLRGVVQGAALQDPEQARAVEEIFANIVVVRGDDPMPPRELLALSLPAGAQQAGGPVQEDGGDERSPFNPFERGPEITEVR
ncbi:DUF3710 domain-containing protein [Actinoallomurus rhizosphaericola]|uniref:DUF3710 domain-containing protein n=1 Tax=Actinoallomurus rhizosphaericola TaxID=2952536 RepID=UPI0020904EE0|nr:DUF3710 domain-containing protein [Actinoallomurus rhizosphaericola]MCO5993539.1 DUF3710 domain-containing protein [Actinoallomurus rhizosphaericola]